jgi:RND family efflux transporter MFP subunit
MSTELPDRTNPVGSQAPPKIAGPTDSSAGHPDGGASLSPVPAKGSRSFARLDWRVAVVLLLIVITLVVWLAAFSHEKPKESPASALTVAVATVTRQDLYNQVTIPAEFRPYVQVDLHAKVSGYVEQMNVDIGDHVKAGQLLATLEVPELKDQLNQAMATEKRAEADYRNAHLINTRLQGVNKEHPNLVAQQDLDTAEAKDHTTEAAIAEAKADREKYQTLLAYTQITAPFDGVITHRYADPGSLIQAGTASDTQTLPLVQVSDNYRLRLDFPVSVAYVKDVRIGDSVEVRVESLGSKSFSGTITRAALKVDEATRTMVTEIEVPNPKLELVPGMYAEVNLKVGRRLAALAVPIQAVNTDKQATVYLVNQGDEIEERPVSLGLETPDKYEILTGLQEGDKVMIGNRSQVKPGQKVDPKVTSTLAEQ